GRRSSPGWRAQSESPLHRYETQMTPERWARINALFEHAIDLAEPDADSWLAAECHDDPELRQEVQKLVRRHRSAGTFLETPATPLSLNELAEPEPPAVLTSKRFEIRKFLGKGG